MTKQPWPGKVDCLERLIGNGVPVSEVLDVGVREGTYELIRMFPDLRHHLFEPASPFFGLIGKNYAGTSYQLHEVALSDEDAEAYIVLSALLGDGVTTHAQIRSEPVEIDGATIVDCMPLMVRRFDSLGLKPTADFLLKVDVDGKDLEVLRGFGDELAAASIVMVEATHSTLLQRAGFLVDQGFELFDLVDLVYYGPSLYQLDAVFVRRDLVSSAVRPPIKDFVTDYWKPLSR